MDCGIITLMSKQNDIEDTAPFKASQEPVTDSSPKSNKPRRWRWIVLGFVLILLLAGAGAGIGYYLGIQNRLNAQAEQVAMVTTTQFELGVADLNAGRYDMARKRFEYIIQVNPEFPGIEEKLAEVLLKMATVATPTEAVFPTPTIEPTQDLRGEEQIFNHADLLLKSAQWSAAIETLDILRKQNLDYRPLEVDGMYYIALRFRGLDKIIIEGNLEGGIYDLTLAEQFAPIDKEADGFRSWARYYLTGSSFWDVNWSQVVYYFGQVYSALPNLRDGAGWTATERFRVGSIRLGDEFMEQERYCEGRDQYLLALSVGNDSALAPTATKAQLLCAPPTSTPAPATPTSEIPPTEEPTEETPEPPVETPVTEQTPTPTLE